MKLLSSLCISFCLLFLFSCNNVNNELAEHLSDSIRSADSAHYAEIAKAEEEKTNPETFDFDGRWEGDIMTLVFSGDTAQLITITEKVDNDWYKMKLDRTTDPMQLDFYKGDILGFSMILRIDSENSITVGFGDDMTVRPSSFVPDHSVTCIKKNTLVH